MKKTRKKIRPTISASDGLEIMCGPFRLPAPVVADKAKAELQDGILVSDLAKSRKRPAEDNFRQGKMTAVICFD
jgi:hypothetical protein